MINNLNKLDEKFGNFMRFESDFFFNVLLNPQSFTGLGDLIKFDKETFIQYLLLHGIISDPKDEIKPSLCNEWATSTFFRNYLKTDLEDEFLNKLLLDVHLNSKEIFKSSYNSLALSKEAEKKLMRVAKIDNDFYIEHVDKLGKFYNILKRNNPNLKDDSMKLVTLVEKEDTTLADEIKDRYNLSSKKIFSLPSKYFLQYFYHFNWNGIKEKYNEEMTEIVLKSFRSGEFYDVSASSYASFNLFGYFILRNPDVSEEEKVEIYTKIKMSSIESPAQNDIKDIFIALRETLMKTSYNREFDTELIYKKTAEIIEERLNIKISYPTMSTIGTAVTNYKFQSIRNILDKADKNDLLITQENFDKFADYLR